MDIYLNIAGIEPTMFSEMFVGVLANPFVGALITRRAAPFFGAFIPMISASVSIILLITG
ncbi:MAG: hypothetical protein V9G20_27660 [Candidatus Promineifilaceae bacterium]